MSTSDISITKQTTLVLSCLEVLVRYALCLSPERSRIDNLTFFTSPSPINYSSVVLLSLRSSFRFLVDEW